ncbi:major facilitator superfamily domain-containing protein [Flagelloscypha sp. PMI_526]|nr:major facilitator superfamily domain-containing protein [Flagelloscypha sp. PMI_526]
MGSDKAESVEVAVQDASQDATVTNGARTVEATHKVYGKYSKWALFIGLGLAAYIYSLDGQTTYTYLAFATSSMEHHSLLSSVQTAQAVIIAVFKPVVAKFADVTSRGTTYVLALLFYVLGYIVIASAKNIGTIAGGIILYAVGYTGLQLLNQIIIADITSLRWRGLVSGLLSMPFVINAFIGSEVSAQMLARDPVSGWRWGYGMFAILIPASLAPLITTLLWAERKAKKLGVVASHQVSHQKTGFVQALHAMDVFGLLLIAASISLILLPMTLSKTALGGWHNPSIIAMIVLGVALLPVVIFWEVKYAKFPVIPLRFLKNRAVMSAAFIGFFDFVSFYLTFTYLYSYVNVEQPSWSLKELNYFIFTQTVALSVFGLLGGVLMSIFRHYKYIVIFGLLVRLLGVGIMIHSRGGHGSTAELVWTQILQGLGGGFVAIASQVGAQASVTHADVATATAFVLLVTEIGFAVGSTLAGVIWASILPGKLVKYLPNVSQAERDALYASMITITKSPAGDPIREGAIAAYGDTMRVLCIAATCIAIVPLLLSFLLPNYRLGDKQNAVDDAGLDGESNSINSTEKA